MEKKPVKYFKANFFNIKLYLEDIESIISILDANNLEIEISDDENVYRSIKEIIEFKGENPKNITIEGKRKDFLFENVTVRLTDSYSSVSVNHSEYLMKVGYDIEKILRSKKRKWVYSFLNSRHAKINFILNIILILLYYIYFRFIGKDEYSLTFWYYLLIFWVIIYIISELNPDSNTKIELERRHKLVFNKQKKEKVIVGILMLILGSVITLIATFLTKQ